MKFDVVIAGGGPAGATCAQYLAENDVDVILFEKGNKNRYKACAGGIMWHNQLDFGSLPSEIIERDVGHLIFHGPNKSAVLKNESNAGKIGQLTYRNQFDCYLREQALRSGAEIETNSEAKNVEKYKDYIEIEVKTSNGTKNIKADALVIATGIHGNRLHRKLNMDCPVEIEQAIQAEYSLPRHIIDERFGGGAYELFFDSKIASHGYTWIFTKKEGLSVGMCNKKVDINHFRYILKHHPILQEKLKDTSPIEFEGKHIWSAPIPDRILEYIYGNRVLLIGDAAGFSDRFTYEGIWHARISGKIAAKILVKAKQKNDFSASFLQKYQKKCSRIAKIIQNSQRMHHLIYHSGYMDLLIDTIAEILENNSDLATKIAMNIQTLLEGFLEVGNDQAIINVELLEKLLNALNNKVNKKTLRNINKEIAFAYSIS
ncbi:MAG: NAD(P)/FAD-dependent oxidoreductase [Candidatus Helarchaeota archaeon]